MRVAHLLWWLLALEGIRKLYTKRLQNKKKWSTRRLYTVSVIALSTAVFVLNGFRTFSRDPTFQYWGDVSLGLMFTLWATIPCSLDVFNDPLWIRRSRDVFWIVLGISMIVFHYPTRW